MRKEEKSTGLEGVEEGRKVRKQRILNAKREKSDQGWTVLMLLERQIKERLRIDQWMQHVSDISNWTKLTVQKELGS
jgi:hypothetical protein